MRVKVKLFANFRDLAPPEADKGQWEAELAEGATLDDLVAQLGLSGEKQTAIIMINGRVVNEDYQLCEGDEVSFFPPLAGG